MRIFTFLFCCLFGSLHSSPCIAVNGIGDAVVLWTGLSDDDQAIIQGVIRPHGEDWSAPISLSSPNSFFEDLALNEDGEILAVWQTLSETGFQIETLIALFGEAWGMPQSLPMQLTLSSYPKVALDSNGNGVIVWQSDIGSNQYAIFASSYLVEEGMWTAPRQLSSGSSFLMRPALAVHRSTGDAVVIWQQLVGLSMQIQASIFSFDGEWSDPIPISDGLSSATNAKVAFCSDQGAIIIWRQDNLNHKTFDIHAVNLSLDGTLSDPFVRSQESCLFQDPNVAGNEEDLAIVIWTCTEPNGQALEATFYSPATHMWQDPIPIVSNQTQVNSPKIAMDSLGRGVAVWTTLTEEEKFGVQGAIFSNVMKSWSSAQLISSPLVEGLRPAIGIDAMGNAIAIWEQDDSTVEASLLSGETWGPPVAIGVKN